MLPAVAISPTTLNGAVLAPANWPACGARDGSDSGSNANLLALVNIVLNDCSVVLDH